MINNINQIPYLRTSREFPEDMHQMSVQMNKSYIDIAGAVNNRIIGLFPVTRSAITGESWYIRQNARNQTIRQVFTFTSFTSIPHPINFMQNPYITRMWGQFTDGTNWYGLIPGTTTAIAGQVSFYLTPTSGTTPGNIVFVQGSMPPTITKGIIVLEWMSNV